MNPKQPKHRPETVEDVILGLTYQDVVTGIKGVATSRTEYLNGCVRVNLEWAKDGDARSMYLDIQQLALVPTFDAPEVSVAKTGGNRPDPPSRSPPTR